VGTFVTETAVAMLNVAIKISLFISLPLLVLNTFISPKFAVWFKEDKIEKLQSTYWRIISATVPVSIVIFALGFVLGEQLLHFFGEEYLAAFTALWILCLGQCVNLAFGPVVALLVMTGQERFQRKLMVSLSIATVVTLLIVVPSYGILGAATITAANLVLLNVISFVRLLPLMTK
jgi:O-antigen/teichoic acid export membrane protein